MKHLFIVKPGEFNDTYQRLTSTGMLQVQKLGRSIEEIIKKDSVRIISSDEEDSYNSAKKLAGALWPVDLVEFLPYLNEFGNESFPETYVKSIQIIDERKELSDSIIIISNEHIAKALVPYALNKYLDKVGMDESYMPGTGMHIDLEKRACGLIPKREY